MMRRLLSLLLLSLLSFSMVTGSLAVLERDWSAASEAPLQATKVLIEPQNSTATVGSLYTITVRLVDVADILGFDVQIRWGTSVLKYVSHTPMAGQAGGVLNSTAAVWTLQDVVDETASIDGSALGTTYWYACVTIGAAAFSGSGTFFTMTFQVLRDGECDVYFTSTALADKDAKPISHMRENAYFYWSGLGEVPVASYTFSPDPAVQDRSTTFDASGSSDPDGEVALYIWNFRDGTRVNTTSATTTHNFTTIPPAGYYDVELTVLDDQGGGSQSKPTHARVFIVHPRPVARFTVWPEDRIAVVDHAVLLNASRSYDPDPGGSIVEYRWDFGDGNLTNTLDPVMSHVFQATNDAGFTVKLVVIDDSDGLASLEIPGNSTQLVRVVERRDIEVIDVTASPGSVKQGEDVAINVTLANKGQALETFNLTAYYNTTMTDWVKVDETSVSDFSYQYVPELEFMYGAGLNTTLYHTIESLFLGGSAVRDDTRVRVGNDLGYWSLNPGFANTNSSSPALVAGTPLPTGGWIWEEDPTGSKQLNGEFAAGNWTFRLSLYATRGGVNATIWGRILKCDRPDPQANGATTTVIKDWAPLFPAATLSTTARLSTGQISVPSMVFADEYMFFEFQLQVTDNTAGNATTDVVFRIGGLSETVKSRITGALFSYHNTYTLSWTTDSDTTPGNHLLKVETTQVPHETDLADNMAYSNPVQVAAEPTLALSPGTGFASTTVTGANFDPNSAITVTWDGTVLPTVPSPLVSDGTGSFAAIISVPTQTAVGFHTIAATDGGGNTRQATFTVIAMTGPAGSPGTPGATGATGETGPQGPTGPSGAPELSYAAIVLALIALAVSMLVLLRRR